MSAVSATIEVIMKHIVTRIVLLLAVAIVSISNAAAPLSANPSSESPTQSAAESVYPVKVSDNGRYFVDQQGRPVFWLGTTQWQLFREYTLEEARTILEKTKDKGFVFRQVMLMGVGDGTTAQCLRRQAMGWR